MNLTDLRSRLSTGVGTTLATILAAVLLHVAIDGQVSREMFPSSVETIRMGPAALPQVAGLSVNADQPSGNTVASSNTAVTVTAALSNQLFKGVGTGEGNPAVIFGAGPQAGNISPKSLAVFDRMSAVGSPVNSTFSGTVDGQPAGIDVSSNSGFRIFTSVRQFAGDASVPTGQRIHMADLTLTFSSPVSDPYLHLVGLGARIGAQTYTTELETASSGVYFERVTGNVALQVQPTLAGTSLSTFTTDLCEAMAGCGTVRLVGKNLTSVTFRIYVRGNGGTPTWGGLSDHNGDEWMIGVSLPQVYNLAGSVFLDQDGPATIDGLEITEAGGLPLYVNLVDPTDMSVIGIAPLGDWGWYEFTGVPGAGTDHYLELSTVPGSQFDAAPPRTLPPTWMNVGEQLRLEVKPGNDGSPDGRLNVKVTDFYYSDALFAIGLLPGTTATVTGRVFNYDGRSVLRSIVQLVDPESGTVYVAYTNSFGYFRLTGVPAGYLYTFTAMDKKRGVSSTTEKLITGDVSGINLIYPEPVIYPQKRAITGSQRLSK